jgi:hypothetical protein
VHAALISSIEAAGQGFEEFGRNFLARLVQPQVIKADNSKVEKAASLQAR